jgi:acetylornithine deacetylase/succinyl-diaminopimelate desuccinylase-like protein
VWNAKRRAITLEVCVKGRAAHVALQHQGINAVERALPLLMRLVDFKREIGATSGSILLVGGRVAAGSNLNIVPAECRSTIDRRTDPDEDFDAEKRRLLEILDAARGSGVDLEVRTIQEGRSSVASRDAALARGAGGERGGDRRRGAGVRDVPRPPRDPLFVVVEPKRVVAVFRPDSLFRDSPDDLPQRSQ